MHPRTVRAASAEAGATLLLLLLLPAGLFAGGAGGGAIGRFLAAPLAAAAAAAAGAGAGAVARATDAEFGATLLPRFFAGSLGIVPRSGGVLRPPDRRGTFDFTAIGPPAACAPASARANDRVREKNIVGKRGLFRIRARQGTTGVHSSPSGPAAAHLELRIAVLVS